MKRIFAGFALSLVCLQAFTADGRWTEGYGQGNLEYFIDQSGIRLLIGCPTEDGSADAESNVSLQKVSDYSEIKKFTITVNGLNIDGPFSASSRVGDNNFLALLDGLKKTDAVVNFNGKSVRFPKSNAAKVIPTYGKKFECNLFR